MLYLVVADNIYHSHWPLTKDVFCLSSEDSGPVQIIADCDAKGRNDHKQKQIETKKTGQSLFCYADLLKMGMTFIRI